MDKSNSILKRNNYKPSTEKSSKMIVSLDKNKNLNKIKFNDNSLSLAAEDNSSLIRRSNEKKKSFTNKKLVKLNVNTKLTKSTNMLPKLSIINSKDDNERKLSLVKSKTSIKKINNNTTKKVNQMPCFLDNFMLTNKNIKETVEKISYYNDMSDSLNSIAIYSDINSCIDKLNYTANILKNEYKYSSDGIEINDNKMNKDANGLTNEMVIEEAYSANSSNSRIFKYNQLFNLINSEYFQFQDVFLKLINQRNSILSTDKSIIPEDISNVEQDRYNLNFNFNLTEINYPKKTHSFQGIISPQNQISFGIKKIGKPLFKPIESENSYINSEESNSSSSSDFEIKRKSIIHPNEEYFSGLPKSNSNNINENIYRMNIPFHKTKKTFIGNVKSKNKNISTIKIIQANILNTDSIITLNSSKARYINNFLSNKSEGKERNLSVEEGSPMKIKVEENIFKFKKIPTLKLSFRKNM